MLHLLHIFNMYDIIPNLINHVTHTGINTPKTLLYASAEIITPLRRITKGIPPASGTLYHNLEQGRPG